MARRRLVVLALSLILALPLSAGAVSLSLQSESSPYPGITVRKYRTSSPSTNVWVALVDLCASRVHVEATKTPTGTQSTGSWGASVGAQLATNGDFYKTSPLHVYGDAVGNGVRWPYSRSGLHANYASEWFYHRYGWIAFGPDWVDYTHSEYVKQHGGPATGWRPSQVPPPLRPGTLALVSGFPEVVADGVQVTCSSPTASSCFPDRTDMRSRNPRTAMGLTQDKETLLLVVVDGRTSSNAGMYGSELAELMKKLGAWVAFNLDGGGSSQMWVAGQGYLNDYSGNNLGNGVRSMVNHWGVFAGTAGGKPTRPGHCMSSAPCKVLPAGGGKVEDSSSCFHGFGPSAYWREVTTAGSGGSLHWTNAFSSSSPSNWAWWQLNLAEAGQYQVQWYKVSAYAKFAKTRYVVRADGGEYTVVVDQGAGAAGWRTLGTYDFAAGGDQWVAVYDHDSGAVASDQHIIADAVRLVRVGPWCGDGDCEQGETCGGCEVDCGPCPSCGDGECNGQESCSSCPGDCGACPPSCGDGECNGQETCSSCVVDCGACPPSCGDGECNGQETCSSCVVDCGACPPSCGDGACNGDETCASCVDDCGPCPPSCGDGQCADDENCQSCVEDCGACPPSCGDGSCDPEESCESCPDDCGGCAADSGPEPAAEPGPEPVVEPGPEPVPDAATTDTANDDVPAGASVGAPSRTHHLEQRSEAGGCAGGNAVPPLAWLGMTCLAFLSRRRGRARR